MQFECSIHLPCIAVYDLCKARLMGKCHDTSEQHRAKPAQIKTEQIKTALLEAFTDDPRINPRVYICDCRVPEAQRQSSGLGPPGFRLRAPVLGPVECREISLTCFNRNSTEHCALTKDAVNRTQVGQRYIGLLLESSMSLPCASCMSSSTPAVVASITPCWRSDKEQRETGSRVADSK